MTTKAGFYGSDAKQNRFRVPELKGTRSQNEAYFVLVNKAVSYTHLRAHET